MSIPAETRRSWQDFREKLTCNNDDDDAASGGVPIAAPPGSG